MKRCRNRRAGRAHHSDPRCPASSFFILRERPLRDYLLSVQGLRLLNVSRAVVNDESAEGDRQSGSRADAA